MTGFSHQIGEYNDDEENNLRVYWSRNDHMVIFDDTEGEEKFQLGAQACERLDIKSAPIWQDLDSSKKVIEQFCEKDTIVEAKETISFKCKNFILEAEENIFWESTGASCRCQAGSSATLEAGGTHLFKAGRADINPSWDPPTPEQPLELPEHKHPPTEPE